MGNALEVAEAIETLRGNGPRDFTEHCLAIGAEMLVLGGLAQTSEAGREMLVQALAGGQALAKFREWVAAQGGDASVADDVSLLPQAPVTLEVHASQGGYLAEIDARAVGLATMALGAGRERKGEP